jgi:hypothetical protein
VDLAAISATRTKAVKPKQKLKHKITHSGLSSKDSSTTDLEEQSEDDLDDSGCSNNDSTEAREVRHCPCNRSESNAEIRRDRQRNHPLANDFRPLLREDDQLP